MEVPTGANESSIIYQKTYLFKGHITGVSGVQALLVSSTFLSHTTHSISPTVCELPGSETSVRGRWRCHLQWIQDESDGFTL